GREPVTEMTANTPYRIGVHGIAALIAAHRDDWAAAARHLAAVADVDINNPYLAAPSAYLLRARALAAERAGDPAAAAAVLARCLVPEIAAGMTYDRHKVLPPLMRLAAAGRGAPPPPPPPPPRAAAPPPPPRPPPPP